MQDRGGRGPPGLRAPAGGKGEPALPGGGASLRAQVDDVPGAHVGLTGQSARNRGPVRVSPVPPSSCTWGGGGGAEPRGGRDGGASPSVLGPLPVRKFNLGQEWAARATLPPVNFYCQNS